MLRIDQVPAWYEMEGISHVVTSCGDGMHLLCDRWIVCGPVRRTDLASKPGKRICRRCRHRLKTASLKATPTPPVSATR